MGRSLCMKNKVLVFDLDDTLVPELSFLKSAFKEIAEFLEKKNSSSLFEKMMEWRSRGENVFENLCKIYKTDVPCLLAIYRNHSALELQVAPETLNVLENLRSRGFVLGMITDGRSRTQRSKIKSAGLEQFFANENIIISEEFGSDKTNPKNFEYFMAKYPSAEYFYIGDNPKKDFFVANSLGWKTICLLDKGENIHKQNFNDIPANYLPKIKIYSLKELAS